MATASNSFSYIIKDVFHFPNPPMRYIKLCISSFRRFPRNEVNMISTE